MSAVEQLGYLVFEVSDLAAWERFATGVLGLMVADRDDDGALLLRNDERAWRIRLEPGPADDLAALGWQVADDEALDAVVARLNAAGCATEPATAEQAAARRVARLVRYRDLNGVPSELFCGAAMATSPFHSEVVHSGFVAGDQGVGHCVISAADKAAAQAFYEDVLGLRLSDHITCEIYGYPVDIAFMHANVRHHSVAFGGLHDKHIHHFMLEVGSVDDVGLAYDRTIRARLPIANTLGRHPNDGMFSFYAHTPSGFQFEVGFGGREVDDATWQPTTYDHISQWGHHPPVILQPRRKKPPAGSGETGS